MFRKIYKLLPLLLLLSGCSINSGRLQLFNYDIGQIWSTQTPDRVTVRRGDTLYSIAKRYNVPMRELIEINRLSPPYTLTIGRVLRMPSARYHVVQKGDTLYNISKRYNVSMTSLSRTNNLSAPFNLKIGQRLLLPGTISGGTPTTTVSTASAAQTSVKSTASKKSSKSKTTYTPPSKYRKTKFSWPVKGTVISQFGTIGKGRHNDGINIKAAKGTAVKAADAGTVAYAGNELKGFGNLILIKHKDGWITAYAHNEKILVKKGQKVIRGEKIATVGATGGVNTPQLHFEVRAGKKAYNPLSYLK